MILPTEETPAPAMTLLDLEKRLQHIQEQHAKGLISDAECEELRLSAIEDFQATK